MVGGKMRKADSVHSNLAQKILDEADPLFLEAIEQETVLAMLHNDDDKELRFYKLDEATRFCQVGHYVMKSKRLGKGLYWWTVEDVEGNLITYSRSHGHSALHSHAEAQRKGIEYFVTLIKHHYKFTPTKVTFVR